MWLKHWQWHDWALKIAGARAKYGDDSEEAKRVIGEARQQMRWNLDNCTANQRHWQRVSRRVTHSNHYDSWTTREKYVTGRWEYDERQKKAIAYSAAQSAAAGLTARWHKE